MRTLSSADFGVYGGMYFFLPGSSDGASVMLSFGLLLLLLLLLLSSPRVTSYNFRVKKTTINNNKKPKN